MTAYERLTVGTDGSETAAHAVDSAARLAAALGVPLTVTTAWYRDMPEQPLPSEEVKYPSGDAGAMEASWADMAVSDGASIARKLDVSDVHTSTPQGHPADALLEEVADDPAALLVVGTAGLGSRTERVLGNVPHQITHHAPCDVLLIRSDDVVRTPYERIAIGTDGSSTAETATRRGLALAEALGAEPTLVTVSASEDEGEEILARVRDGLDGEVESRTFVGSQVTKTLVEATEGFDLLVIGNKGMSGPSRLLGSVANGVTHTVPTDLLLVNTVGRRTR